MSDTTKGTTKDTTRVNNPTQIDRKGKRAPLSDDLIREVHSMADEGGNTIDAIMRAQASDGELRTIFDLARYSLEMDTVWRLFITSDADLMETLIKKLINSNEFAQFLKDFTSDGNEHADEFYRLTKNIDYDFLDWRMNAIEGYEYYKGADKAGEVVRLIEKTNEEVRDDKKSETFAKMLREEYARGDLSIEEVINMVERLEQLADFNTNVLVRFIAEHNSPYSLITWLGDGSHIADLTSGEKYPAIASNMTATLADLVRTVVILRIAHMADYHHDKDGLFVKSPVCTHDN